MTTPDASTAGARATVGARLVAWTSGLQLADVPASARRAALRHLLDGVGTALAARRAGVVDPAVAVARGLGGPAQAPVLGDRDAIGSAAAAFGTGALVHGLDFDDTHAGGLVHATAVVLPAAFAVGLERGATGAEVLAAAVAGYETVCRVAAASPHGFHARGLHATAIAGALSSAVVAARLAGLDAATTLDALGIAGSAGGGLLEFLSTGSSTKQLHPGSASLNGVLAARLAEAGASGPGSVLEGPHGVYAALSAREADPASVVAGLGERFEVERITVKPYPSCQLMHVTLDAVRAVLPSVPRPEAVTEVVAYVHPDSASIVCEPAAVKLAPRTPYDAKFSLPWSVAALLVDRSIGVDTYAAPSIARPEVAALARRVRTVVADPGLVAADAPGRVEVALADGTVLLGEVPRSVGTPESPLDDEALLAKFLANAGGTPSAHSLAEAVLGLADAPDLRRLHALAADAASAS